MYRFARVSGGIKIRLDNFAIGLNALDKKVFTAKIL